MRPDIVDVSDYRVFLTGLSGQITDVDYSANFSNGSDILQIRDEILIVIGNTESFSEFDYQQYMKFVSLTRELYQRMCSEQRFVANRAKLYEMLVNPNIGAQVVSL
jgi:hypothetical protein